MQLYSDWPLAYIAWILFCVAFWLTVGIVIMARNLKELKAELKYLNRAIAEMENV